MSTKRTILIFIDWFWPGYLAGGPVQSVVSLVQYLNSEFNFKIVTTNCDIDEVPYTNIETNTWIDSPLGCSVFYINKLQLTKEVVANLMSTTPFDVIYINSFFSKYFSIIPLQLAKKTSKQQSIIVAPRGMLGEGALQIKSVKKKLFIHYAKLIGLHKGVVWQATSKQEEAEIKKVIGSKCLTKCISNLPKKIVSPVLLKKKVINSLNVCFVSRISPKKNLHYALQVLKTISNYNIQFSIIGPAEDKVYWLKCKALINDLPKNITVIYNGSYKPEEMNTIFENQHVLLLPSLNENFGHVIVESLLYGCPVIVSNQTPWVDLEINNAGYSLSLGHKDSYKNAIIQFAQLNENELLEKNKAAVAYIREKLNIEAILSEYKQLFK